MPKGKLGKTIKARPGTKPVRRGGAATGVGKVDRRQPRTIETPDVARKVRSDAMRLAAEVERLERELAAARSQMATLAERIDIDPLTELPNRRAFERELVRSLAYVKRHDTAAALLYLDLDDFKRVNDRHGHAAGDAVLRAVAHVLNRHVRASDVVARIGGDEFVVLLWNCDEASARIKAMAMEAAIQRTTAMHAGAALTVAGSIGITGLLPLDRAADTLERADAAMYARKAARHRAA